MLLNIVDPTNLPRQNQIHWRDAGFRLSAHCAYCILIVVAVNVAALSVAVVVASRRTTQIYHPR